MVVTQQPFSPRPLGPLDTRRRRRRVRRALRRTGAPVTLRVLLVVCMALGLLWASGSGLARAMHMLSEGPAPAPIQMARASSGLMVHLGLPQEYSARIEASAWPQEDGAPGGAGVSP